MSQVLESAVLNGLLAGVSRQGGVELPNMLRNMLQQFTQNPQIMNTVQQIAQQVDGQAIEDTMSGGTQGSRGSTSNQLLTSARFNHPSQSGMNDRILLLVALLWCSGNKKWTLQESNNKRKSMVVGDDEMVAPVRTSSLPLAFAQVDNA
ncbi:hypothetical protein Bca4012_051320 [Brassica carinata]